MYFIALPLLWCGYIVKTFSYRIWNPSSLSTGVHHRWSIENGSVSVPFRSNGFSNPYRGSHALRMIWCYPILGDGPDRKSRRKINQAFERGPTKVNISLPYEYANRLAQNQMFVPFTGLIPFYPEEGLGRTEDVYTPPETACGEVDIDPYEFDKIKEVYTTFNDNGCGVLKLLGAKGGHFSFKYCGPIKEKYGIKAYLTYLVNLVYPGAKITILTEHAVDAVDQVGVDPWLYAKQRRLIASGRDYMESFRDGRPHEMGYPEKFDMLV
ncbi:hypothetical protein X943_002435 [Babesia divergens]|uniref:Uncharacterized protein n=1 Tax=Babesia divergens TaxID=32595 RepID=A0AAD9LGV7_BABDI|nr:hypothetical protein X943_002435 [Babesia divergens]